VDPRGSTKARAAKAAGAKGGATETTIAEAAMVEVQEPPSGTLPTEVVRSACCATPPPLAL
jgi:hypothetical protein